MDLEALRRLWSTTEPTYLTSKATTRDIYMGQVRLSLSVLELVSLIKFTGSILVAHSDHEHVSIADLEEAVKGYKALIKHSLK